MNTQQIAMLALMFVVVFCASLKAMTLLRPDPLRRRIEGISPARTTDGIERNADSPWLERMTRVSERVGKLSLPKDDLDHSALRRRFMNAGLRQPSAPAYFFAAKSVLALVLPTVALIAVGSSIDAAHRIYLLFLLLSSSALGFYLPNVVLARMIETRQRALFEDLPDALDLMTVCVEAGLGLDAAMLRVTEELGVRSTALKEEFELVLLELRAGAGREKALRNLSLRTGVEDIDTLAAMLIQADRFGTSVGDSLRVFIDNLRTKRRLRAEEKAAKIALKLLFPLMFCIFPTLIAVLIGPAAIQIVRQLFPVVTSLSN
ncbi:tight adherence protein C [Pararobbsia alpina]|uniref:type II secretion system F family protein n=1 Tax=Pararobbsia alpina TaxID=621374 RepID=UPI0039A697C5